MVELREEADGRLARGHGGDTLNTAVYMVRLGLPVDYVTALGDDAWSDEMVAHWQAEGIGTALVQRLPGRLPGLYVIQTDRSGERRFQYWRDSAAARRIFDDPHAAAVQDAVAGCRMAYLSGITLSILDDPARARLFAALGRLRAGGGRVAFDTNYRPRGWPDPATGRALYRRMFASSDVVFASSEDLQLLFGDDGEPELMRRRAGRELVLKQSHPAVRVVLGNLDLTVAADPVARVVDTTAAGDSFAAAYLAARLRGAAPDAAARAGHRLAGVVAQHPGAIIPRDAMPTESFS